MNKLSVHEWVAVATALVIVLFLLFSSNVFFGKSPAATGTAQVQAGNAEIGNSQESAPSAAVNPAIGQSIQIQDTALGTGDTAENGDTLTVNYVGTLTDGTKFDASADHGKPFQFILGAGQVIPGWDLGLLGMKVGGKRHLVVPAELAYGNRSIGSIPANSTLMFDIELLDVAHKSTAN